MAVSFQCMTKFTTNKKKIKIKIKKEINVANKPSVQEINIFNIQKKNDTVSTEN